MSCFFFRSCSWEDLHGWGNLHAWALKLYRKILGTWVEMSQRTRATWTIDQSTYIWSLPVACDFQSMGMLLLGTQHLMIKQPMSDHSQRKWHKDKKNMAQSLSDPALEIIQFLLNYLIERIYNKSLSLAQISIFLHSTYLYVIS